MTEKQISEKVQKLYNREFAQEIMLGNQHNACLIARGKTTIALLSHFPNHEDRQVARQKVQEWVENQTWQTIESIYAAAYEEIT